MNNPYAWNIVNPDLCYGRDALLSEMLSGLPGSPRCSFGVAGGRRIGKTTLLRRVERELRASIDQWQDGGLLVIPVYIDGQALPRPLMAADLWNQLLHEIQQALPDANLHPPYYKLEFGDFKEIIKPALANLSQRPRVIVMFDEIEPILVSEWSRAFLDHWRALLSNTPGLSEYFTAVFAGAREITALQHDVSSPLADILEWHRLRALSVEDASSLMQDPIDIKWSESFLERAYNETGGHPMLLQYIMQQVCNGAPETAMTSLQQALLKFENSRRWQFNQWWSRYCSPTAQRVYSRLPDDNLTIALRMLTREFGLDEANNALEILQHVGLAAAEEDGFAFRYSGEMFRRWYRKYGAIEEAPQHDPELAGRLAKVSTEASNKYLSAWRIYQSDMPNYSGVLVEVRGVLEYLLDVFAPNEKVLAEMGFTLEKDRQEPSLRQRIRFLARQMFNSDRVKEIVSDYNLLEITGEQIEQIARTTTQAHRSASGMAHDTATRDQAFRALKQWDSILAQLLPDDFALGTKTEVIGNT
jgi:hypothetical protein